METTSKVTTGELVKPPLIPGFVCERDLAQQLGLSTRTLWRWRNTGYGPKACKCGKRVVYSLKDVTEWFEHLRTGGRPARGRS